MMKKKHDLILFDLGGVLIDPSGVPKMLEWSGGKISRKDLWAKWLTSSDVRAFETGKISVDIFADSLIEEFHLPVTKAEFIPEFKTWAENLYPGARELLNRLSGEYTLATLSNTNALHWDWFQKESGVYDLFSYHFPSHLTGFSKPDEETFYNVLEDIPFKPENILFVDDNEENIISAINCGFQTACASGFEDVLSIFSDR